MLNKFPKWFTNLLNDIFNTTYNLFKIMIPIIIIVKIIEELGGIQYIALALEPFMSFVGLPSSVGLVWATTMITNIYGGMVIFMSSSASDSLSIAQVTILGSMMLMAHALPIEVRIAQKAGVRILFTLLLRIGSALLLGLLLHKLYSMSGSLTELNQPVWEPSLATDATLAGWVIEQLKMLFQVLLIISVLLVFLRLLKATGIEKIFIFVLKPLLKIMGLSERTTTITIVGVTLGLTYGGGLLINEAKKGDLSKMDIFGSLSLLALCHSLIEDTLLIMLLGADLSGILYARLIFSVILITLIIHFVRMLKDSVFEKVFVYQN